MRLAHAALLLVTIAAAPSWAGPLRTVDAHGIATVDKRWSSCTASAPADWTMVGNESRTGIGVDLASADRALVASYGVVYVTVAVVGGRDVYWTATPERFLETATGQTLGVHGIAWDPPVGVDGDVVRTWRGAAAGGAPVAGIVRYHVWDAGTGSGYILAYRSGLARADRFAAARDLVYDVAASARCTKHFFPPEKQAPRPRGSSKDLSTLRQETTMGWKNVYSPSTGEHWEASTSDYNPTGPDGPGYYRQVGSSYEKLAEGFGP